MPRVVGEVPSRERLIRLDVADLGVEQGHGVVQPVHPVLAKDAEQAHAASHFERTRAGAARFAHHLGLITLVQQPLAPASPL
jgi:hypothetical protein